MDINERPTMPMWPSQRVRLKDEAKHKYPNIYTKPNYLIGEVTLDDSGRWTMILRDFAGYRGGVGEGHHWCEDFEVVPSTSEKAA